MKQLAFITFAIILFSCENNKKSNISNTKDVELLKKENEILKKQMEIDSLKRKLVTDHVPTENKEETTTGNNRENNNQNEPASLIRTGKHLITLQWISFGNPSGSVMITKISENKFKVEGGQKAEKNSDYLKIKGTLTPINKNELIFEGTLIYKVQHNNSGLPCDKSGRHLFKSTQNRKYWRMQEMINCEGGMLTDYVDIFF